MLRAALEFCQCYTLGFYFGSDFTQLLCENHTITFAVLLLSATMKVEDVIESPLKSVFDGSEYTLIATTGFYVEFFYPHQRTCLLI